MPSVDELPSGRWRVRWRDAAGNRHSPPGLTFPNATMARNYGLDQEAKVRQGHRYDPKAGRMLLADFAQEWFESYVAEPRTVSKVRGHIDLTIKAGIEGAPALGDRTLDQLDHMSIQAWVKRLEKLGRAPGTVAGYHRTLSTILRAAVKNGRLLSNPADGVRLPTAAPPRDFYWQREETDAIRAQLSRPLDLAVFDLLLGCGPRWGEMAGLHSGRWLPLRRQLSIMEVLEEEKGFRLKAYPKGKKGRVLPVAPDVVESVAVWLAESKPIPCGLVHPRGQTCSGLIFHDGGEPLSRHAWPREVLAPAIERAKVRPGSPHALRHTYASWLVIDGVPLRIVQALLGHASIRTTERYSHLAPPELDDARVIESLTGRAAKAREKLIVTHA